MNQFARQPHAGRDASLYGMTVDTTKNAILSLGHVLPNQTPLYRKMGHALIQTAGLWAIAMVIIATLLRYLLSAAS